MSIRTKIRAFFNDEHAMMMMIVLNTIVIFIGGFWQNSLVFEAIDAMFTLVFVYEAYAKIKRVGWQLYWADGWNKFDFIIIVLACPAIIDPFVDNSVLTGPLIVLRTLRLFKSFKLFHFVPNIGKLLKGMSLAFRASFLVFIAFLMLLVVFAILSSTMFGIYAPEYFGNPGISIYSIFRLFTIEGWYEMPDIIASNSSVAMGVFARVYFAILLFLGGIIGMSLINSIFVDAMVSDNNDEVLHRLERIEKLLQQQNANNIALTDDETDEAPYPPKGEQ